FSMTRNREDASIPQLFMNDITGLAATVIAKPAEAVNGFVDSVDNLLHTYEENQQLKQKIDALDNMQARIYTLDQENMSLKQELELQNSLSEFSTISSSVISRNPDTWVDQIIVDKGSEDGVAVDMSVMSGNGLIG